MRNMEIAETVESVDKYLTRTHNSRWTNDEVVWLIKTVSTHLSCSQEGGKADGPHVPVKDAGAFPLNKKLLDKYEQKVAKRFNVVVGRRSRPEA